MLNHVCYLLNLNLNMNRRVTFFICQKTFFIIVFLSTVNGAGQGFWAFENIFPPELWIILVDTSTINWYSAFAVRLCSNVIYYMVNCNRRASFFCKFLGYTYTLALFFGSYSVVLTMTMTFQSKIWSSSYVYTLDSTSSFWPYHFSSYISMHGNYILTWSILAFIIGLVSSTPFQIWC
jgi:hypothetical protein